MTAVAPARRVLATGSLLCALAVAAGAFGAHGLRESLEPRALEQWNTAATYLMYAGLGTAIAGAAGAARAGLVITAGGVIFFLAVGGLGLGGPRWLGAVAPIGGLSMMAGFAGLAWRAAFSKA